LGGQVGNQLADAARIAYVHAGIVTMLVCAAVGVLALIVNQRFVPAHVAPSPDSAGDADNPMETAGFFIEPPHF